MPDYDPETVLNGLWADLNATLLRMTVADEAACEALLQWELQHRQRVGVAIRVHSRYNKLRAERERREIIAITGQSKSPLYGITKSTEAATDHR